MSSDLKARILSLVAGDLQDIEAELENHLNPHLDLAGGHEPLDGED